jgi:uncharacterized NAD(P)/FAD-binding protein YdhS
MNVKHEIIKEVLALREIYKNEETYLMAAMLAEAAAIAKKHNMQTDAFLHAAGHALKEFEK